MTADPAREYRQLWRSGATPPDVFAFLGQHTHCTRDQRLAVLLVDQSHRWEIQKPLQVEEYLALLPEFQDDEDAKLQLAIGEFQARQDSLSEPGIDEFTSRFPDISERLREELTRYTTSASTAVHGEQSFGRTVIVNDALPKERLGRYRLIRLLGEGAFGRVYLGFDEQLQRPVAVKEPTPARFRKPSDADAYLDEARTVASLDHPNIVPVHDVGHTDEGSIYLVSKFIEGCTLRDRIRRDRPGPDESARIVRAIADALQHAHDRRIVHRDVKPGNILLEEPSGTPYITDFGLAIAEDDFLRDVRVVGTPAYMSPEQARGEGHRLDGRSDVFSLGIVCYELLTGRKPFRGSSSHELMEQVIAAEPRPPRDLDESIPVELERICLKSLSKRVSERYQSARELAEDLRSWKLSPEPPERELQIVPRGLRSFDADDADFFLDLLPGPRNRDGLPNSIQFWKARIEERDAEKTFSVGLVYGPSGCGKSSLIKAGLLPRLSDATVAVYVEATLEDTESRIQRGLRKRIPGLPGDLSLVETFAHLRRSEGPKIVVVLDQFEQWLHAHRTENETELVNALRQCDGARLQAIVMVRDDFAMAAAGFMDSLDIPILQGQNFETVDLFDVPHAEKVLAKFGQAFGRLPARAAQFTDEQREFVATVAAGLAQDGKVVPVRLALFAEMIKGKLWVPETLEIVGGTAGIGVNFLEETFSARTANPRHRLHQQAAREVLNALLPEVGTDIKGTMRSHGDLLEASGYREQPARFNELLRILDGELRLITPTAPEGTQSESVSDLTSKYYQLTHDYLVPSLRNWLTRKRRETRRGRAELLLAERTALWQSRRESRQLPTFVETVRILMLTDRTQWSQEQAQMMSRARRRVVRQTFTVASVCAVLFIGVQAIRYEAREERQVREAQALVKQLVSAEGDRVHDMLRTLRPWSEYAEPALDVVLSDPDAESEARTRVRLALLPSAEGEARVEHVNELVNDLAESDLELVTVARDILHEYGLTPQSRLVAMLSDRELPPRTRLQALTLLATTDVPRDALQPLAAQLANDLLAVDSTHRDEWAAQLRPVMDLLVPHLMRRFLQSSSEPTRLAAIRILAAHGQPDQLVELLLAANALEFSIVFPSLSDAGEQIVSRLQQVLHGETDGASEPSTDREIALHARRNAAVTLLRLGYVEDVWPHLQHDEFPDLRSTLIRDMLEFGVPVRLLLETVQTAGDSDVKQASLLALGSLDVSEFPAEDRVEMTRTCLKRLECDEHQGVRSAVTWLMKRWDLEPMAAVHDAAATPPDWNSASSQPSESSRYSGGGWSRTSQGHTLAHVHADPQFVMGSPESEAGREVLETLHSRQLGYSFGVSIFEVTVADFQRYRPDYEPARAVSSSPDCPANVSWIDAVKYCRWLSQKELVEADQMCYPAIDQINEHMELPADFVERTGYRLLTEVEWEYVCRAGSRTRWFCGDSQKLLLEYARCALNSEGHLWPVGSLKPNPLGLFDISGNAVEWCHNSVDLQSPSVEDPVKDRLGPVLGPLEKTMQPHRGGSYIAMPKRCRSAQRYFYSPRDGFSFTGFRIARTLTPHDGSTSEDTD